MKRILLFVFSLLMGESLLFAQKVRPDAFPPVPDTDQPKALAMATTVEQMYSWDRYPTYSTYLAMMQRFATNYPAICRLDTIGTSVNGRLILCVKISDNVQTEEANEPEFFYSSTMHGDEITGFYFMLRLIDTLLTGYGVNEEYTDLIDRAQIYINPLANPDGTYNYGDNTVQGSMRYNAHYVDLNRNYPDPFGSDPFNAVQPENTAMINYLSNHRFLMSANLHGGSEVMNYPWDSFTSNQQQHPQREWFQGVCKRYVDTCRKVNNYIFTDVENSGIVAGGVWYVITNGRQDYVNYYHNCREVTMEVSSDKKLSSDRLDTYWRIQHHSLVNYIKEVFSLVGENGIDQIEENTAGVMAFPNPTKGFVAIRGAETYQGEMFVTDIMGREVMRLAGNATSMDLSNYPNGIYLLHIGSAVLKILKR